MTEEGNAPIQDPMELGEMANWTPLDGSEGLKRKRAESIEVTESDTEHWLGTDNTLSEAIEVITEIANGEYKSQTLRQDILSTKEAYLGEAESFGGEGDIVYSVHLETLDGDRVWGGEYYLEDFKTEKGLLDEAEFDLNYAEPAWRKAIITKSQVGSGKTGSVVKTIPYEAESPSATIPVNYPKHLQPDWQKTPASHKKMAKEMKQALETEDPAARHAALFAMQDKYGDYWNQQGFNNAFKKEMEGSEPSWVKPVATALGFGLGFLGIKQLKKEL